MNSFEEATKQAIVLTDMLIALACRVALLMKKLELSVRAPSASYENLLLDIRVDLQDLAGKRALVTCRQRVRFLVEESGVLASPVWGEGRQLQDYTVEGARRLGERSDGPRKVQLLALNEKPSKDGQSSVTVRRSIKNGFTKNREYFEAFVERPTLRLSVSILFPKGRPPASAHLVLSSGPGESLTPRLRRDGRALLQWSLRKPQPRTVYSLRWAW